MKYASLKFDHDTMNLGDVIQSIAAERFLPQVDIRFDRDSLNNALGTEKYLLIMNGWFTTASHNWPPSEAIIPVFVGFHMSRYNNADRILVSDKSLKYLKQYEPIGCRDRGTSMMLSRRGIETYYSKCLTLTFPRRTEEPLNGKVYLVDVEGISLPEVLELEGIRVTHSISHVYSEDLKIELARYLLDMYKSEAILVITTRLHCALPCIAFGIPVVFFGDPKDYRISLLIDLGLQVYTKPGFLVRRLYKYLLIAARKKEGGALKEKTYRFLIWLARNMLINRKVDWTPRPLSIEGEKDKLIRSIRRQLKEVEDKYKMKT